MLYHYIHCDFLYYEPFFTIAETVNIPWIFQLEIIIIENKKKTLKNTISKQNIFGVLILIPKI